MGDDPGEGFGTVVGRESVSPVSGLDGPSLEDNELDSVVDPEDVLDDDELAEDDDSADADDEADDGEDDDEAEGDDEDDDEADSEDSLDEEGEIAADYIEGLLDIADLDGDIDMDVEGDRAVVSVVGATLDELVGDDGEVLEALQELTRLAVHRKTGLRARLMLDVGGFRARRRAELAELGRSLAAEVERTGEPRKLRAMTPFERKIVHDAVAEAGSAQRVGGRGAQPPRGDLPGRLRRFT